MQQFGISIVLTNIVFHWTIKEILGTAFDRPDRGISLKSNLFDEGRGGPRERSIRKRGLFNENYSGAKQSITSRSLRIAPIRKCCPAGTAFDVNALLCKRTPRRTLFPRGPENVTFSIGVPECVGTALYSVSTEDADFFDSGASNDEYCIDEEEEEGNATVVLKCGDPSAVCKTRPCIRKCKPFGEFYGLKNETEDVPFSPSFYNLSTLEPDESATVSSFGILFGIDCKEGKIRLDKEILDVNYLGNNGSLYAPGHRESQVFSRDEFCIEYVQDEGFFAFLCLPVEETSIESVGNYVLLALGFLASFICLLATLIVYLCSKMSKSLYGKSLMFYVTCLCIAYLSLAIVHLCNHYLKKEACVALGYSMLLSFLAAFFWLNVMSLDIWRAFRHLRSAEWRKSPESRSRFAAYSIYAWGTPLGITIICGVLDAMTDSNTRFEINMIRPDIGSSSCWFSRSTYGMYVFFVAPVSLIITCNFILYMNTVWRCWRIKSEINKLGVQSMRSKGKYSVHKEQLLINGKLFIVMGVSWGPEFISTVLPHPLWKITDALNSLLGVFIFIIFVMKKKVINNVAERVRVSFRSVSQKNEIEYMKKDDILKNTQIRMKEL